MSKLGREIHSPNRRFGLDFGYWFGYRWDERASAMDDLDPGNNPPRTPRSESIFLKTYMELDAVVNSSVPGADVTKEQPSLNVEQEILYSKRSRRNSQHSSPSQRPPNNACEPSNQHVARAQQSYFMTQWQSAPIRGIDAIIETRKGEQGEPSSKICRYQTCQQSWQLPQFTACEQQRRQHEDQQSVVPPLEAQQQSQRITQSPMHKPLSSLSRKQGVPNPTLNHNADQYPSVARSPLTQSPLTTNPGTSIATSSSTAPIQQQSNTGAVRSVVDSETNITDLTPANAGLVRHMNPEQRALVLIKRKIRNRLSAKRSRARRREVIGELAEAIILLREQSEQVKEECEQVVKENHWLKRELQRLYKREE